MGIKYFPTGRGIQKYSFGFNGLFVLALTQTEAVQVICGFPGGVMEEEKYEAP